ncbi:MAG: hypothetical protein RSA26_06005 [Mucinivorans sp.]
MNTENINPEEQKLRQPQVPAPHVVYANKNALRRKKSKIALYPPKVWAAAAVVAMFIGTIAALWSGDSGHPYKLATQTITIQDTTQMQRVVAQKNLALGSQAEVNNNPDPEANLSSKPDTHGAKAHIVSQEQQERQEERQDQAPQTTLALNRPTAKIQIATPLVAQVSVPDTRLVATEPSMDTAERWPAIRITFFKDIASSFRNNLLSLKIEPDTTNYYRHIFSSKLQAVASKFKRTKD